MRDTCSDCASPAKLQLAPPSVLRYTPFPIPTDCRGLPSPVPTQTRSGFAGETTTSPTDWVGASSKIGRHATPPLVDSQTPPDAAPTKMRVGSVGSTSTAATRPLIPAGPMLRAF